jgi:NADH-quinone oxidoreductase subunit G
MCDAGRYGWKHAFDPQRLIEPRMRRGEGLASIEWEEAIRQLDAALRQVERLTVILSPFLTVEESYLLATYARQVQPHATLVLGPVPEQGEDQSFAGGFVIAAEKCPNRRGVAAVIAALADRDLNWDAWLAEQPGRGNWDAVWWAGGYPRPWQDSRALQALAQAKLVIVQDLFASPLTERADWQLPATAFAERAGSYVNRDDRLQSFAWAIRPPRGVLSEGQLYWRLLGREGMYQARAVLAEVASQIVFFSAAHEPVPAEGVDLRIKQLS